MLHAPINVVFFCCLCYCLSKIPGVRTLRFYGFFSLCVWGGGLWDFTVFPLCGDFDGILRLFPCGWGLWDFTVFLAVCVGPLCLWTLRFYVFFPVCAAPVLESLKIFKKNPQYGKIPGVGIWNGSNAAKKKRWQSNPSDLLYIIWLTLMDWSTLFCCLNVDQMLKNTLLCT